MAQDLLELTVVSWRPTPIEPLGGVSTVTVQSGATVYYGETPSVSIANNQGSIAVGASQTFTGQAFLIAAGTSAVQVVTSTSPQVSSGNVTPLALNYRGSWQANTVYKRGDVTIDPVALALTTPEYVLRWASKDHTSPSSLSATKPFGTSYTVDGVQWHYLPINGVFRGPYITGSQYHPGDICVHPTTGGLIRALYQDSGGGGSFDSTRWADIGIMSIAAGFQSDAILPVQGKPETDVPGHGFWPIRSRLRYPKVKPLAVLSTSADFTSATGTITQDTDPIHPNGSPVLAYPGVYTKTLGATVDLRNQIVRYPVKIPGSGATRNGHGYFEVSADNFASGNYAQYPFNPSLDRVLPDGAWGWGGCGPSGWTLVGTGSLSTILSSVNSFRFNLISTGSTCAVHRVDVLPNNGQTGSKGDGKAKCVIWFDDSPETDWTLGLQYMLAYGFPGTIAAGGAVDYGGGSPTSLTMNQVRYMCRFHGWQMSLHYYFANDGDDPQCQVSPALDAWIMAGRHAHHSLGLWGNDDYAWHDSLHMTAQNWRTIQALFRSARKYNNAETQIDTLPPVDPYAVRCKGVAQADINDAGAGINAMIDVAIANAGLFQFTYDPSISTGEVPGFQNILAHLDANRANIDVVTFADAVAPWTVPT